MFGSPLGRRSARGGVRNHDRPSHFTNRTFGRLHVLAVPIHVAAVLEPDRVEVARIGIDLVRRRLHRDSLADRKQLLRPSRASQHVHGPHLAPVVRHAPGVVRDVKVEPRVRIDQLHARQLARIRDGLAQIERAAAMMCPRGHRGCHQEDDERGFSNQGHSPTRARYRCRKQLTHGPGHSKKVRLKPDTTTTVRLKPGTMYDQRGRSGIVSLNFLHGTQEAAYVSVRL